MKCQALGKGFLSQFWKRGHRGQIVINDWTYVQNVQNRSAKQNGDRTSELQSVRYSRFVWIEDSHDRFKGSVQVFHIGIRGVGMRKVVFKSGRTMLVLQGQFTAAAIRKSWIRSFWRSNIVILSLIIALNNASSKRGLTPVSAVVCSSRKSSHGWFHF